MSESEKVLITKKDNDLYDRLVGILVNHSTDADGLHCDGDDVLLRIIRERDDALRQLPALKRAAFCAAVVLEHERGAGEVRAKFADRYELHHWGELERALAAPEIKSDPAAASREK